MVQGCGGRVGWRRLRCGDRDVRVPIALLLEQNRIHRHLGCATGSDRLGALGPPNLVTGRGHIGVVRHVLRLEGRNTNISTRKNPTETSDNLTLPSITGCPTHRQPAPKSAAGTAVVMTQNAGNFHLRHVLRVRSCSALTDRCPGSRIYASLRPCNPREVVAIVGESLPATVAGQTRNLTGAPRAAGPRKALFRSSSFGRATSAGSSAFR